MKKLVALSFVVGVVAVPAVAVITPAVIFLFLFGSGGAFALYAPAIGLTLSSGIVSALFTYFVSGFLPTTNGNVANFIMGL